MRHDNTTWQEFLKEGYPAEYQAILSRFPGIERIYWSDPWQNITLDVDPDYSSWLADAIEDTGLITWMDGEPFAFKEE